MFNAFNHANFGLPENRVFFGNGSPNAFAGRIFNTQITNREIQFGLKIIY